MYSRPTHTLICKVYEYFGKVVAPLGKISAGDSGPSLYSNTPPFYAKDFVAYTMRVSSAPFAPTLPAPPLRSFRRPPTVWPGPRKGNLLRRVPLNHFIVCSKVMRATLSSCLFDTGLRGRSTPFPHSPLQDGALPASQKRLVVFSASKHHDGLDLKNPSNFRPISNISFLSKTL